jgi:hypothetical protein
MATMTVDSAPKSPGRDSKTKKKGLFGGLFGKKNKRGIRKGGRDEIPADGSI